VGKAFTIEFSTKPKYPSSTRIALDFQTLGNLTPIFKKFLYHVITRQANALRRQSGREEVWSTLMGGASPRMREDVLRQT
jgi:hypothetical protein